MAQQENSRFSIAFIGKWGHGKYTLINALAGKILSPIRATIFTTVITIVEYGNNTNNAKVVYSDATEPKNMTIDQFIDEFALSEEEEYMEDGNRLARFANISHVEMQSTDEIFADGFRFIDSPALEEKFVRQKLAMEVIPNADAIIFTLSAVSLFSTLEKEYIAENFAGKNMRNVFFVINRIDNLTEDQLESKVKPSVRMGLADVFTDINGRFDEELYNRRVFFTNSYGALCVRTGEQYIIILGRKEIPVDIEIEDTGIIELENELRKLKKEHKGDKKMAFVNQETKAKLNSISTNMKNYSTLVDEPVEKGSVGMGMRTEANVFRENATDVENGVFKVLVMGKFKNGKSTFINALVGKVMMAARATACTAVIATVEYGNDTNNVKVVYSDSSEPKNMTLGQFTEEFALSDEDQQYIEDGGRFDRFANISHVEMQSTDEIFADGLRLIDSPGLEEATSRTKATNEFVPKANAIIFTLSAVSLFSAAEKEYIAENFAGKNMRNVFFVINRIDNLTEGQLEASVKPSVRKGLADVFTDTEGHFNEELYNKRVFFTNAYGALCARTGEKVKIIYGKQEIQVDVQIENTGMLEFEESLREFLNSNDRINATFNSTLQNMANTYQLATARVKKDKAARNTDKKTREENARKAEELLQNAMADVEHIQSVVKTTGTNIANKLYMDMLSYVQTDIPREFAAIASNESAKVKFGMDRMFKLALANITRNNEKVQEVYKPFVEAVEKYTKTQLQNWDTRVPTIIDQDICDMEEELEVKISDFAKNLVAAENMFAYGTIKGENNDTGSEMRTLAQNIISFVMNRDYSYMIENTAKGGSDWMTFAKRFAGQAAIDVVLFAATGGLFIPIKLFLEVVSTGYRAKKMANDILVDLGNKMFIGLWEGIKDHEVEFKEGIINEFVNKGNEVAATANRLVEDRRDNMNKILNENQMSDSEAKAEDERADSTLSQMHGCIDAIYNELYGRMPTETEFLNLAKNEKKK